MAAPWDRKEKRISPGADELERAVAGSEKLQVKSGYSDNTRSMSRQLQKSRIYSLSLPKTAEARPYAHTKKSRVYGARREEVEMKRRRGGGSGEGRRGKSTRGRQSGQDSLKTKAVILKRPKQGKAEENGGRRTGNGGGPRGCVGHQPIGRPEGAWNYPQTLTLEPQG
jgi:hypothetical protein